MTISDQDLPVISPPEYPDMVPAGMTRLGAAQLDVRIGDLDHNVRRISTVARQASGLGCRILAFPECALTGYCFADPEEALGSALEVGQDPATLRAGPLAPLLELSRELSLVICVGYLERQGRELRNSAAILADGDLRAEYHKAHLPHLGVDRFVACGTRRFETVEAAGLCLGMQICYDGSFPEASRLQALAGADLILLPTNWPAEAIPKADWLPNTRAYENVLYFAAINRVGEERGFSFPGRSRICDPTGATLVAGPTDEEALLVCDVDPKRARNKRIERREGYFLDRIADRRTDLYDLEAGSGDPGTGS